ncbi:hypothetical protein PUN28_003813 [Cardiocondyla obscurior]|uniref:Uncharacterized protein n=1 Tax=Cardiocondyla obscurior TaxID=286306 RepID=A0AAW2GNC2_9HYME
MQFRGELFVAHGFSFRGSFQCRAKKRDEARKGRPMAHTGAQKERERKRERPLRNREGSC